MLHACLPIPNSFLGTLSILLRLTLQQSPNRAFVLSQPWKTLPRVLCFGPGAFCWAAFNISSLKMAPPELDETTLAEIAGACRVPANLIEDVYTCTPLQEGTMAESAVRPGASLFQFVLTLALSVDLDRFCIALRQVVSRNAILRTRIVDCHCGLVQVVTSEAHFTQRRSGDVEKYLREDKARPPDLGMPLFRSAITGRKLVLTMHHAIMDHTSIAPFVRDVVAIYRGHVPDTHAPFKDFVAHCVGIDESAAKDFWAARFKGAPSIFPKVVPDHVALATQTVTRKIVLSQVGAEVPLAHVPSFLEAAWALTAATYTRSESVAFGLVLSGRTPALAGAETTLGPTIAIVPVQVSVQPQTTVQSILKEVNTARQQLQKHAALHYGITRIRAVSEAARVASGFQTLLNIRPSFSDPQEVAEVRYEYMQDPRRAFAFSLTCDLTGSGITLEAASDPAVVCESQLHRILAQFEHILTSLLDAPGETKLGSLQLLSPGDREEILRWNDSVPETVEMCIHDLFRARAREQPEAPAVEAADGCASYGELDQLSDRLAHELRRRGVSTGDSVAFVFEKSLWTPVAVLAIMKAGGACVPIDKSDPPARKAAIVSGANAKTVLTSVKEHTDSIDLAPDVVAISAESISRLPDLTGPPDHGTSSPGDLAYIIFTSGSTGVPKGVMLEHRCLASALGALSTKFSWQQGSRILQFAAHVWDISMGEMFGALLSGACLCIPSEKDRESSLAKFIESSRVNWAWLTPTVIRTLSPSDVPSLESLLSIGEPIDVGAAKIWGSNLRLINGWGPCEASILSAVAEITPDSAFPESIGTPLGCALWIVNVGKTSDLASIGAVGEVLVEGPGVARGYLNDEAKTAASFIAPPTWAPARDGKARHFYRTGDLARYNPDGTIGFLGRQDNQVKVRGQRFELGELESVLASCGKVRDVFATTKISGGRTELVAVICLADARLPRGKELQELPDVHAETTSQHLRAIRDHVNSRLPTFMVPTIWLAVERMPRTASAKLNRSSVREWLKTKNLSSIRAALDARMTETLTPPATAKERLLQSVWSSVLAIPEQEIGRESSFFRLGGDSILAMQVASRCRKHGLETTTAALLKSEYLSFVAEQSLMIQPKEEVSAATSSKSPPQVDGFAGVSRSIGAAILSTLNTRTSQSGHAREAFREGDIESIVPATDIQAIMLATGETGGRGYHIDFSLKFTPPLDTARLQQACARMIQHHPILRSVFVQHGPALYLVALKESTLVPVVEARDRPVPEVIFQGGASLARFHLTSDGQLCQQLCLEIHHALYDAVSLGLVFQDLDAAYAGNPLSDGPHFHSWVSHVGTLDDSAPREFWREALRGSSISHLVPPPADTIRGGHPLDEQVQICVPLQKIQTSFGTPSTVLKAAWAILLSQALGTDDVVFGEVSANRYLMTLPGTDQVRGPCVNMVPSRARLDQDTTLASLIKQMQGEMTASLPYHHLGIRSIIKDCTDWPRCARFSSALVYQNHGSLRQTLRIGDANAALSSHGKLGDSADLWIIAKPGPEDLEIDICFHSSTIPSETAHWISRSLLHILESIPSSLQQPLSEVGDSLRNAVGCFVLPTSSSAPTSGQLNGTPRHPSTKANDVVWRAWTELELLSGDQDEDCSMFRCGADVVTALLLSEYYRKYGYNMDVKDLLHCPRRAMQANLMEINSKEIEASLGN